MSVTKSHAGCEELLTSWFSEFQRSGSLGTSVRCSGTPTEKVHLVGDPIIGIAIVDSVGLELCGEVRTVPVGRSPAAGERTLGIDKAMVP